MGLHQAVKNQERKNEQQDSKRQKKTNNKTPEIPKNLTMFF